MSLRILYPGHRNTLASLAAAAFTRQNFGNLPSGRTSDRITANTPDGELGGMVAMISGDYEVDIYDGTGVAAGLFINDAVGSPFENTPAVASGKSPYLHSFGSFEVDVYETQTEAGGVLGAYVAGDNLYGSDFGLLTREATYSGILGVCTKAPSATDVFLALNLRV